MRPLPVAGERAIDRLHELRPQRGRHQRILAPTLAQHQPEPLTRRTTGGRASREVARDVFVLGRGGLRLTTGPA
jgi:hypothetical protein